MVDASPADRMRGRVRHQATVANFTVAAARRAVLARPAGMSGPRALGARHSVVVSRKRIPPPKSLGVLSDVRTWCAYRWMARAIVAGALPGWARRGSCACRPARIPSVDPVPEVARARRATWVHGRSVGCGRPRGPRHAHLVAEWPMRVPGHRCING
jgi:hypothetical protein